MPSKNKKQLNFFLLVKAYKESGEMGVKRQWKFLEGSKPRLTPEYMGKLIKTALSIKPADLIDLTSGIDKEDEVGDKRDLKAGFWALFRGKYKPRGANDEIPKEAEFIAQIKRVDVQKGVVNFNHNGFRNKFGQTMEIPKRANISSLEHVYLDYALFDNVIRTGKNPQEVAREKENMEESIRKIVKEVLNENLEQHEKDYEEGYLTSKWMYENTYEDKKKMFINDSYEALTSFFGTLSQHENFKDKHKRAMFNLGRIFDESMKKKYDHGIGTAIMTKSEDEYKRSFINLSAIFGTGDTETVHEIIDGIFNGE